MISSIESSPLIVFDYFEGDPVVSNILKRLEGEIEYLVVSFDELSILKCADFVDNKCDGRSPLSLLKEVERFYSILSTEISFCGDILNTCSTLFWGETDFLTTPYAFIGNKI